MKLIATDLDGTLLNDKHEVSAENVQAIRKAQELGIGVVVVTGRSYDSALLPLQSVGLSCPIICLNGAQFYTEQGEITRSMPLHKDVSRKIMDACLNENLYFEVFTNQGVFSEGRDRFIEVIVDVMSLEKPDLTKEEIHSNAQRRFQDEKIQTIANYDELFLKENLLIYKLLAFSVEKECLDNVYKRLNNESMLAITSSGTHNLEFNHLDAQKGPALSLFAESIGIPMEDVMAIGDNYNDLSMLLMAGRGVAMGNAEEGIKAKCHFITSTNKEHGVAYAIEEMLKEMTVKK